MRAFDLWRTAAALSLAAAMAGCAVGAGGTFVPRGSVPEARSPGHRTARATFRIAWAHKRGRRPRYIGAAARSVAVSVNGGPSQYANAPVQTIVLDAPVGYDNFAIAVYDENAGQGNILGRGSVSKRIVLGARNAVSATLEGVVASMSIALSNPSPAAGAAAQSAIQVTAFDADGNAIVGPADYQTSIQLSVSDPEKSGALSLSSKVLQSPSSTATLSYSGATLWSASVVASDSNATPVSVTFAPKPTVYEFPLPLALSLPSGIAAGPDGRMWFTEEGTGKIGAITTDGHLSEYGPASKNVPSAITAASDGTLWFTEQNADDIARITTAGVRSLVGTLPLTNQAPASILDFGDGTVWYGAYSGGRLGRIYLDGTGDVESSIVAPGAHPVGLAYAGAAVWFADCTSGAIGRTPAIGAAASEFPLPAGSKPNGVVAASDGRVWFADAGRSRIGAMDLSGNLVADYPTRHPQAGPFSIAEGADGALWFTDLVGRIGRMTTNGVATDYAVPGTNAFPYGIAVAVDGSIWFTEFAGNKIGKLVY
jgi:virginiamycin B lyase